MIIKREEIDSTPGDRVVVFYLEGGDYSLARVWREKYLSGAKNKRTEEEYYKEVALPYFKAGKGEFVARKVL